MRIFITMYFNVQKGLRVRKSYTASGGMCERIEVVTGWRGLECDMGIVYQIDNQLTHHCSIVQWYNK